MRGAVWVSRCLYRARWAFQTKATTHNKRKANSMTLDEILNGTLEQEIRQGLLRLEEHTPRNARPSISVHVWGFGSPSCFVSADLEGMDIGSAGFGHKTLTEAVNAVIAKLNDPQAMERRRKEVMGKIATLQAELQTLEPMAAVMES